jgi:hypothetical protein
MDGLSIFSIFFTLLWVWIIYEGWRAPMMKENEDGSFTTIRPAKKFKDLFKKRK